MIISSSGTGKLSKIGIISYQSFVLDIVIVYFVMILTFYVGNYKKHN